MKKKDNINYSIFKRSTWAGLMLVLVAALTLEATSLIQFYFSQRELAKEATNRAETQLEVSKNKIMGVISQAEAAVRNSVWIAQWALRHQDSIPNISTRIVSDNPVIMGSTMALVPGFSKEFPLYSPYVYRNIDNSLDTTSLASAEYDYPHQEWFVKPIEIDDGYWSEPYIDTGGGEILMTTFSEPIKDRETGKTAAVLTGDISLDWLSELIGDIKIYPNATGMVLSRTGNWMVNKGNGEFKELKQLMLTGESGSTRLNINGNDSYIYYAPIERTGWSMCIAVPKDDIFGDIRKLGTWITLLQLLGLAMLIFILRSLLRNQAKYRSLNEREKVIENELHIARNIQMSMIPKTFPPFPERHDLDMAADIVPAKEIGGDLYDFFIRGEKLFFCIGDVSGKGVPAALVMAVTRSVFRSVATHEENPGKIVTNMNDSMVDVNENNMFVTFFCGVLDLTNGHLRYCNAGHNPPLTLTDAIRTLPVEANLPLGIIQGFDYVEQKTVLKYDDAIFFYTDGLSEAENKSQEQFGVMRIKEALHGRKRSEMHLKTIQAEVGKFVGDAPQSDDLTMLFIHYLGECRQSPARHSITLTNKIGEISKIEDFINGIATDVNLDKSVASKINLAIEEAVTNVVKYAYPDDTVGTIDVSAVGQPGLLTFTIADSGTPFDPTQNPEPDLQASVQERPIGGLGIHLVRTIMDSVQYEYRDGKNILTLTKNI
ncbi:MAG: SpoIIE family protein phosphatase [Bacteroidales bacterium]|nr:SpoIIE family protein phosphatase [Bacteroidales bacterium]